MVYISKYHNLFKCCIILLIMIVCICKICGYKTEKKAVPEKCPYCGKPGAMRREESANELLDEKED